MKPKLTVDEYGTKEWKLPSGERHRENGPAVECINGDKAWFLNGNLHNKDGPAIEWGSGSKEWWINSTKYTEQEYKYKMRSRKLTKLLLE
jgi:hypothetical protein